MPSSIQELDNATGKRKRDGNVLDERDIQREQEKQMKIAAASQYSGIPIPNIFGNSSPFTARPIISSRQRTPGSKRRFLLSTKETSAFPGRPAYIESPRHSSNSFTSLHASLDPFTTNAELYTASPPTFELPYTVNSLAENIRMVNQEISQHPSRTVTPPQQKPAQKMNLNPCHICHRRPTLKKDLDSYTDCEGCGKRCCWICVRQCLGLSIPSPNLDFWTSAAPTPEAQTPNHEKKEQEDHEMADVDEHKHNGEEDKAEIKWPAQGGHKAMICSACCVERGRDGEVRCLGCLKTEEAG